MEWPTWSRVPLPMQPRLGPGRPSRLRKWPSWGLRPLLGLGLCRRTQLRAKWDSAVRVVAVSDTHGFHRRLSLPKGATW